MYRLALFQRTGCSFFSEPACYMDVGFDRQAESGLKPRPAERCSFNPRLKVCRNELLR